MDVSFTVDSLLANFGTAKRQTLKGFVEGFCWDFGAAEGVAEEVTEGLPGVAYWAVVALLVVSPCVCLCFL